MEPNPLPEDRDSETKTLNTITLQKVYNTLQKLETIATQQQQSIKEAHQKLDDLTKKFDHEASNPKVKSDGFYEGWKWEHDFLMSHEYVATNDLLKMLYKIKQIWYTEDIKTIPVLLTTIKTKGVSKYERFPSGGGGEIYININGNAIFINITEIIKSCSERNLDRFDECLNILEARLHDNNYYTDRVSFEKHYDLTWVDNN